ncbi:hypothetical protein SAMN05216403_101161 [Nitrosospira multiformis ATCC 25196]|uniref:Uncharacterized protein n=1 Tax=Nitrosospira multiformis (strain ATCC 25196 / NCIMB 11849 / C 71) TaxID=323848 RepID=A0A1H5RRN8_NITMU|nr:hypothetical protein [Nitrosospira multiformis]SEF40973.1 hypothetical protein SAMN05216403_101161 [Nitrosospira multiformis ATCC 25196]
MSLDYVQGARVEIGLGLCLHFSRCILKILAQGIVIAAHSRVLDDAAPVRVLNRFMRA